MSLTGDPITDSVIPAACRLVWAVREGDTAEVDAAMKEAVEIAGHRDGISALVVVLAGMVPDDHSPSELLAWCRDPKEYLRLRTAGVSTYAALELIRDRPVKGDAA